MAKILFFIRILVVGMITLLASVCYAEKPVFVPPAERALPSVKGRGRRIRLWLLLIMMLKMSQLTNVICR